MTDTTKANGWPRHMGRTREVPLVGYRPRHYALNEPKPASPHAVANGSKVNTWPTATDPQPTKAMSPVPRPHVLTPPVEPPVTAKDALTMQKACLYAAGLVVLFVLVAIVAVNVAAVS